MIGETSYTIEVIQDEVNVIKSLLELLDDCPISLNNDDYVSVFRAIACCDGEVEDIDGLKFLYKENKE